MKCIYEGLYRFISRGGRTRTIGFGRRIENTIHYHTQFILKGGMFVEPPVSKTDRKPFYNG